MQTRRDFLKSAGLGILALASGCTTTDYTSRDDFSEFTRYLGRSWNSLPNDKKRETLEKWDEYTDKERNFILEFYKKPELKDNELDKEEIEELKEIVDYFPWINKNELSVRDKSFLLKAYTETINMLAIVDRF